MKIRAGLFAGISALLIAMIVLTAAGVPWSAPYQPELRHRYAGADFQLVLGSGMQVADGLQVGSVGAERVALQALPLDAPVDAADLPILRYRVANFPRTLELSLVFRREADPEDVQVVSLPWPGSTTAALNLLDVPGWRGRITEIGFMQTATPQLIPYGIPFAPFRLVDAELWSPSWRGGLAALAMDWSAYRPWGYFSVSSVDQEAGVTLPRRPALLTIVEAAVIGVAVLALLMFGWRRRSGRIAIATVLALGWLLLDAVWVGQLYERQSTTRLVYADKSWPERAERVPDDTLLDAAARIRDFVGALQPAPRVLIHASSPVEMNRLQYLAQPINVGLLVYAINPMRYSFPAGTLLVLYDMNDWVFDAAAGSLHMQRLSFPASLMLDEGALRIYRIEEKKAEP